MTKKQNPNRTKISMFRLTEAERKEADTYLLQHSWLKSFSELVRHALKELFAKDKGPTK
jgi:hypothetical protein